MANKVPPRDSSLTAGSSAPRTLTDELDGTWSDTERSRLEGWNATAGAWQKITVDNASGGLVISGSGGGGGAATNADGADVVDGALADAAIVTATPRPVDGKLRGLVKWAFERMPAALGQGTMAQSLRVVVASDQAAFPVTANAGTNLNTSTLALETTQSAANTLLGAVTEAAPATDTASSGLNGRLQRIAQRLSSLIALVPTSLGSKTSANSFAVVVASDQAVIPVSDNAGTLTVDAPVGTPVFARLSDGAAALIAQKTMALSVPVVLASDQTVINVGDIDHDVANTLKNVQIAGHGSPTDVPPAVVSANGDRTRMWVDRSGAQVVRRRKLRESYTAVFRLAEAAARLDGTFTQVANTTKQWATLHHTAAATKEVRLMKCLVYITADTTVGIQGIVELRQLSATTAPATGNPAITPTPHRRGGTAAEAVCLYLPTTQGTEENVNSHLGHVPFDTGISGTTSTANPVPILDPIVLYDASSEDDEEMPPVLPVGTLDGWSVSIRTVGAPVLRCTIVMRFTEEIP